MDKQKRDWSATAFMIWFFWFGLSVASLIAALWITGPHSLQGTWTPSAWFEYSIWSLIGSMVLIVAVLLSLVAPEAIRKAWRVLRYGESL